MEPIAFTARQVARKLQVRDSVVRAWMKDGLLIAVNFGDNSTPKYRILEDDLRRFIESRRIGPAPRSKPAPPKSNQSVKKWF